jgi:hypothetical protein
MLESLHESSQSEENSLDVIRIRDMFIRGYLSTISPCDAITLCSVLINEAAKQICDLKSEKLDKQWCTIATTIAGLVNVVKETICKSTYNNDTERDIKAAIEEFNLCQVMKFSVAEMKVLTQAVCKINSPSADIACRYLKLITTCLENVQDFICEQK